MDFISCLCALIPDFQGGLVVANSQSVERLDGMTGQPSPAYQTVGWAVELSPVVVHTDGTIFAIKHDAPGHTRSLIGINPLNGTEKFSVPIPQKNSITQLTGVPFDTCDTETFDMTDFAVSDAPIVAGDGFAYVAYATREHLVISCHLSDAVPPGDNHVFAVGTVQYRNVVHLGVLRVGPDGNYSTIPIKDWQEEVTNHWSLESEYFLERSVIGQAPASIVLAPLITDSDQGVALSWQAFYTEWDGCQHSVYGCADTIDKYYLATMGASPSELSIPGQQTPLVPVLQAQDGSYVGTVSTDNGNLMLGFERTGSLKWSVAGDFEPLMATADGGVIAKQTTQNGAFRVTFDDSGNVVSQIADDGRVQAWTGNIYRYGSVEQIAAPINLPDVDSLWGFLGGNPSQNGTAYIQCCTPSLAGVLGLATSSAIPPSKPDVSKIYSSNNIPCNKTSTQIISDMEANFGNFANYNGPFGPAGVASAVVTFSGSVSLGATISIHNLNLFPIPAPPPQGVQLATKAFDVAVQIAEVTSPGLLNFAITVNGRFANIGAEIGYYAGGSSLENHIWTHVLQQVQSDCKQ